MQKSLEHYLAESHAADKVLAHARLLVKLDTLYRKIAPSRLGQASHLANYASGVIIIHADNGAIAAKLRQLTPTLTSAFSRNGVECNDVQVKAQARENSPQSTGSTPKPLTRNTLSTLEALRDSLPQSPLREAISDLLSRSAHAPSPQTKF